MLYYSYTVLRLFVILEQYYPSPTPEEAEVLEIVEVVEVRTVLLAVQSDVDVVLYLHCGSPLCCSRTVVLPPRTLEVVELVEIVEVKEDIYLSFRFSLYLSPPSRSCRISKSS